MAETVKHHTEQWFSTPTTGDYGHVSSVMTDRPNEGGDIATTWGRDAKKNAHFIAASCELFEALKLTASMYERATGLPMPSQAYRAIAKAEGRS